MNEESTKGLSDLDSISVCRSEIKVLRQQIAALRQQHAKEINRVQLTLNGLRCKNCAAEATTLARTGKNSPTSSNSTTSPTRPISSVTYNTIGTIVTTFQNKRAVPRQPSVAANMAGTVVIDTAVFNNPDHALCGLEEFSHMWIIFHFHETLSTKVQAKVSPPRLHGERTGVFATRSPHRPCPIGLSLVKIQRIEGNVIHFLGVDMVSGTPVLDLKPYIPLYDYPAPRPAAAAAAAPGLYVDVSERGSPDGQERVSPPQPATPANPPAATHDGIRVAPWILSNARHHTVTFSTEANDRLQQLIGERAPGFKSNIAILLAEDPRSEYVRNRYPDNLYKCAFEELLITAAYSHAAMECVVVAVNDANDFNDGDYEARGEGCGS